MQQCGVRAQHSGLLPGAEPPGSKQEDLRLEGKAAHRGCTHPHSYTYLCVTDTYYTFALVCVHTCFIHMNHPAQSCTQPLGRGGWTRSKNVKSIGWSVVASTGTLLHVCAGIWSRRNRGHEELTASPLHPAWRYLPTDTTTSGCQWGEADNCLHLPTFLLSWFT